MMITSNPVRPWLFSRGLSSTSMRSRVAPLTVQTIFNHLRSAPVEWPTHRGGLGRYGRTFEPIGCSNRHQLLSEPYRVSWRLHPLKGDRVGWWSVHVSGHWRVVLCLEHAEVVDVDLIDYH